LPEVSQDSQHPLASDLQSQLESYPDSAVELARSDSSFQALGSHFDPDTERAARVWLLLQALHKAIPQTRLSILSAADEAGACAPYCHPALADMQVSRDLLVPLSEFSVSGSRLLRRGWAFTMVSTLQSPNSQYWLLQALSQLRIMDRASVRLDPLLWGPVSDFPQTGYRMWWYGRNLDWKRISGLREEEHGRWLPGPLSERAQFIDFVWSPRVDGIHFRCEEVPTQEEIAERGSRYLHAIFDPSEECIRHLDGSIRIYSAMEHDQRIKSHVRSCGKIGTRVKTFSIAGHLDKEALAAVAIGYFVWSFDVARYFGVDVPDQL
jgi:hypothetical protein